MPRWSPLLALLMATAAQAGEIVGRVTEDNGKPLADAVVVAVPVESAPPAATAGTAEVDQLDKIFTPYVIPIMAGTQVFFPNRDNIRHQVYSFSPAKRFELPLYKGALASPILFDTPGVVVLGCNIHDWMVGYIYVAESPWFAKTGSDGTGRITLPAGRYRIRVWHPAQAVAEDSTMREVDVADGPAQELQWQFATKSELNPRRAPVGGTSGYR